MDASVQRCLLLHFGPICVMQCSSEQVQRTLALQSWLLPSTFLKSAQCAKPSPTFC